MNQKIEVFCGLGGVGKTTIATARAISLALKEENNDRILLMTIDPAKRLKQVLNLAPEYEGEIQNISLNFAKSSNRMDVLLMNPLNTFKRITGENTSNSIIKTIMRPNGGMNEIMSLVEISLQLKKGKYNKVILDTPPGKNFVDFLESASKIEHFFNDSFINLFDLMKKKPSGFSFKKISLVSGLMKSGLSKLLSYLSSVTGQGFVEEFIEAVIEIYQQKDVFRESLEISKKLKDKDTTQCFIVHSAAKGHQRDFANFRDQASEHLPDNLTTVLNRSKEVMLRKWQPNTNFLKELKKKLTSQEIKLKQSLQKAGPVLEFHEILNVNPEEHVLALSTEWVTKWGV